MVQVATALLLLGLAIPLAACSGTETAEDPSPSSVASVADAVQATLDAGTAKVTLTLEHTRDDLTLGSEAGEQKDVEGTVDFERHRNALGFDSDRVIVDETTLYLQPAAEGDTRWVKYNLSPLPEDELAPDVTLGRLDVVHQLEYVASIASSLERVGEEQVRGTTTTRYSGFGEADALMRALLPDVMYRHVPWSTHAVIVERSEPVPFDVWVGKDGRVHKVVYDFPNFSSYAGDLTTIELYDFGADVDIELPEATEAGG